MRLKLMKTPADLCQIENLNHILHLWDNLIHEINSLKTFEVTKDVSHCYCKCKIFLTHLYAYVNIENDYDDEHTGPSTDEKLKLVRIHDEI
jgi:hypothetical protein